MEWQRAKLWLSLRGTQATGAERKAELQGGKASVGLGAKAALAVALPGQGPPQRTLWALSQKADVLRLQ